MTVSPRLLEARAFAAPRQPDKFTSWARAVVTVGKHLYSDDWQASEQAREEYLPYDRAADIEAEVCERFPAVAAPKASPTFGSPTRVGKPIDPDLKARFAAAAAHRASEREEYAKAIANGLPPYADLATANDARKARLLAAQSKLFGAVLNQHLPAYWYADGSASEPRLIPIGELVKELNSTGGGNLTRRGYIWRDRAAWYVYLDTAKLAEVFPRHTSSIQTVGSISMDALSPYLRLMISVATKQEIAANNHSTVESLKADLLAEAPKFGLAVGSGNSGYDLSPTWAEEIAKAIRWPGARLGKAKGGNHGR